MEKQECLRYQKALLDVLKGGEEINHWDLIVGSRILFEEKYGEKSSNPRRASDVLKELVQEGKIKENRNFYRLAVVRADVYDILQPLMRK